MKSTRMHRYLFFTSPHQTIHALLFCLGLSALLCCCKSSSTSPTQVEARAEGCYLGTAFIAGISRNIRVTVGDADTLGHLGGEITYAGISSAFDTLEADTSEDSLLFRYTRGGTAYSGFGLILPSGLRMRFDEPSSMPDLVLNRASGVYNLSGNWYGLVSSTQQPDVYSGTMSVTQTGELFSGTIRFEFFVPYVFAVRSGAASGSSFQVTGTVEIESVDYPGLLAGTYAGADTVTGNWSIGETGMIDHGQFIYFRSFSQ